MRGLLPLCLALSLCLFAPCVQKTFAKGQPDDDMSMTPVKPPPGMTREQIEKQNELAALVHQACLDIKASRWYSAEAELQQAILMDPDCVEAHLDRVVVLCSMHKFDEAESEANTAIRLEPHASRGQLSLSQVLEAKGDIKGAVALMQKVIQQYPTLPNAKVLQGKVTLLQKELANENEARKSETGKTSLQDDFFDYVTTNGIKKWKPERFPLKVYIPTQEEASKVEGYKPEYGQALRDAFNDWQTETNEVVRFTYITDESKADIDCKWLSDASKLSNLGEAGEAQVMAPDLNGIQHVDVKLLTVTVGTNVWKNPTVNDVKFICLHELGHALGMYGHSPNNLDIMYPSESLSDEAHRLSQRDLSTVAHLYQPDVAPSVKPGSKEDIAVLNSQGIELAKQGDIEHAMQKFEAANKFDPTLKEVKQNITYCLGKQAEQAAGSGNFEAALSYLQRALNMQDTTTDKALRSNILQNLVIVYRRLDRPNDARQVEDSLAKLSMQKPGPAHAEPGR